MASTPFNSRRYALGITIVALILAATVVFEIRHPPAPDYRISGIVESAGPLATSGLSGGTRQVASVRLTDGTVVLADARLIRPLSAGDGVALLVQPSSFGMPRYVILATNMR